MKRKDSSRLGELQAEGNLGNERNRNSDSSNREKMRNRSEGGTGRDRNREREDREMGEEWSPSSEDDSSVMRRDDRDR